MTHQTIYHGDPYYRKFFFSTDYYQEFDDEENFIPVERRGPLEKVRSELLQIGYTHPYSQSSFKLLYVRLALGS